MSRSNIFYPWDKEKLEVIDKEGNFFKNGNFSLWFNKYIPLNHDSFEYSDAKGNKNGAAECYKEVYDSKTKGNVKDYLKNRHVSQIAFCKYYESIKGYKYVVCRAKLKTELITGLGQTHPSETGMVLDRNMGIPYIPSSSIKGIVRFAYILSVIFNDDGTIKDEFKDKEKIENLGNYGVSDIFGGDKILEGESKSFKGGVIFLDAYPLTVPELKVDIMNPHYREYYMDDNNKIPPADYLSPVPIKFLTVKRGTEFMFRFVAKENVVDITLDALKKAITQEGVGAKTALGYGLFELEDFEEPNILIAEYKQYVADNLTEKEKMELKRQEFIERLKNYSDNLDIVFNEWQNDEKLKNDKEIAKLFENKIKKYKSNKEPTHHYKVVAKILGIDLNNKDKVEKGEISNPELIKRALADLDRYINKGKISKKEYSKLVGKYKEKFKDSKEINEKFSKLKKLMKK